MKRGKSGLVIAIVAAVAVASGLVYLVTQLEDAPVTDGTPWWFLAPYELEKDRTDDVARAEVRAELEELTVEQLRSFVAEWTEATREAHEHREHRHPPEYWGCGYGYALGERSHWSYRPPFRGAYESEPAVLHTLGDRIVGLAGGRIFTFDPRGELDPELTGIPLVADEARLLVSDGLVVGVGHSARSALLMRASAEGTLGEAEEITLPDVVAGPDERPLRFDDGALRFHAASELGQDFERPDARSRYYGPLQASDEPWLHVAVSCALGEQPVRCTRHAVVAPEAYRIYASERALYLWTAPTSLDMGETSWGRPFVYRIPWDVDETAAAVRVAGMPASTHAMRETADGGLDVLVVHDEHSTWGGRATAGDVALLRIHAEAWESELASDEGVRFIPLPRPLVTPFCAAFVHRHVIYGGSCGAHAGMAENRLVVYTLEGGEAVTLELPHAVERITEMGERALALGRSLEALQLSAIELGEAPSVWASHEAPLGPEGERRGWGVAYERVDETTGLLALPFVYSPYETEHNGLAYRPSRLRVFALSLEGEPGFLELGSLDAPSREPSRERRRWSVRDAVGPLFVDGRLHGVLGDHLVQGERSGGELSSRAASMASSN